MLTQLVVLLSALPCTAATRFDVTPIEKVIIMLEDLQTEVITEGKAEAKTYDKFACFCKDMTKEKTGAITQGQDDQATLTGDIEELTAQRKKDDETIAELEHKIEKIDKNVAEKEQIRADTLKQYEAESADMIGALAALDGAIDVLKGSRPSFAQMRSVMKTVKRASFLADALGLSTPKTINAVTSFLQQPEVPMEDYSFKSEGVIKTLEDLKKDFTDVKNQLDADEVKSVALHDEFMQQKTTETKNANEDMDKTKKSKDATVAEISSKTGELTTVTATLLDDQAYLTELAKTCSVQARTWDMRSNMRADELGALTEAISIIKGTVTQKTTHNSSRMLLSQQRVSLGKALAVVADDSDMQAIEEEAEEADATSFVQLSRPRVLLSVLSHTVSQTAEKAGPEQEKREQVIALLGSEGKKLKSTLLAQLAVKVAADPFVKIRKLIQELIERLLQEAADEANHKGWCDKETSAAEQARTYQAEEIVELNGRLANNEALRDKLTEEILVLETEIAQLTEELAKATKLRNEEKVENAATIKEAEEGKDAVEMAVGVLSKFYTKAKNQKGLPPAAPAGAPAGAGPEAAAAGASFVQGPLDDAPDSGFDSGEAYEGKQAGSGGILGMLEVILSDFARTIRETKKEETKAAQDFLEYERTTKVSIMTKSTGLKAKNTELEDTNNQIADDLTSINDAQGLLDKAITELIELHKACVDTGMSYADRVAMREQEIESLKKALCILDTMGPVQTEGC